MELRTRSSYEIFKSVLFALILREMRGRFGAKRFGAFWVVFEPAVQVAILMAMFSFKNVTVRSGIDFPIFLVTGMIPFFLMRNIVFKSIGAVDANRALFAYKQIKPLDTIIARAIIEIAIYSIVYVLFLFVLGYFLSFEITLIDPIRWFAVLIVGIIFSFSLGLVFCMVVDVIPEARSVIRILFFPVYLLSGVIYPIWILPPQVMDWLLWNPYVHIIDELRSATFLHYPEHYGVNLFYPCKIALILTFIALGLYRVRRLRLVAI